MNRHQKLAVSEYFYSLQGEGRTMGIPAIFLRLTGCNLLCGGQGAEKDGQFHDGATWICDTLEVWMNGQTWDFPNLVAELNTHTDFIKRLKSGVHLVITGGEPLLQQRRIIAFLTFLKEVYALQPIVEVETNATIQPLPALDAFVHYWNTSPKLSNSGMPLRKRWDRDILQWFSDNPKTMFKFVITCQEDFEELQERWQEQPELDWKKIVLMPGAASLNELLQRNQFVANLCIQHQLRMSTRLHVEIWNQLTGV